MKTNLIQYIKYTFSIIHTLVILPVFIIKFSSNDKFIKKFNNKCKEDLKRSDIRKIMFKLTYLYLNEFIDFIIDSLIQTELHRQKKINNNKRPENKTIKIIKDVLSIYYRKCEHRDGYINQYT